MRRWTPLGAALGLCLAFTLVVLLLPTVPVAVRNQALHTAVEVSAAWISLTAAVLAFGRFRRSERLDDLWLTGAFMLFGTTNLLLSAIPSLIDSPSAAAVETWGAALARASSATLLMVAAVLPSRRLARPPGQPRGRWPFVLLVVVLAWVIGIGLTVVALGERLPDAVRGATSLGSVGSAHPVLAGLQLFASGAFAAAAVGFGRTGARDPMRQWLAIAAVFAAFSRVHYALLPSLYADVVYTGDVLRISFYLLLVLAVSSELVRMWRGAEEGAAAQERARIARELHDGLAQELAFISSQSAWLAKRQPEERRVQLLASSSRRALDESRRAIETLSGTVPTDLRKTLIRMVEEVAVRYQQRVDLEVDGDLDLPDDVAEQAARIAREAVVNAARHAGAELVRVRLDAGAPLVLEIRDAGKGFDPHEAEADRLRFGLRSMRSRAEAIGGELVIESQPGDGTTVRVEIPWKR